MAKTTRKGKLAPGQVPPVSRVAKGVKVQVKSAVRRGPFVLQTEIVKYPRQKPLEVKSAYSPNGVYIGGYGMARALRKRGIVTVQKAHSSHSVGSVGKDERGNWWGWSHRAIAKRKTRAAAVKFARSVS